VWKKEGVKKIKQENKRNKKKEREAYHYCSRNQNWKNENLEKKG
jgi:hypothetical protein